MRQWRTSNCCRVCPLTAGSLKVSLHLVSMKGARPLIQSISITQLVIQRAEQSLWRLPPRGKGLAMAMELWEQQKEHRTGLYKGSHACCQGQSQIRGKLRGATDQKGRGTQRKGLAMREMANPILFHFWRALKWCSGVCNDRRHYTHSLASVTLFGIIFQKFSCSGKETKQVVAGQNNSLL